MSQMPVSFHICFLMNSSKKSRKKPCCTDLFIECVLGQIFSWYKLAGVITTSGLLDHTSWKSGPTCIRKNLRNWIAGNNAPVLSLQIMERFVVIQMPIYQTSASLICFQLLVVTAQKCTRHTG